MLDKIHGVVISPSGRKVLDEVINKKIMEEEKNKWSIDNRHIEICGRNAGELTLSQWNAMKEILGGKEWEEKVGFSIYMKNFKINGNGKL